MSARFTFGLLTVLGLSACDRKYDTVATYEAPRSGYRVVVTSKGQFSNDYDLNPVEVGKATLTPLPGQSGPVVLLDIPGTSFAEYTIDGVPQPLLRWEAGANVKSLQAIIGKAGYANAPAEETEEMAQSIEGVTRGPKGTLMPGQAKAVKVVSVVFR